MSETATTTVLARLRHDRGWSRDRLVSQLEATARARGLRMASTESVKKTVSRHEKGLSAVKDDLYIQLYCEVYNATPHELFGTIDGSLAVAQGNTIATCHRFTPVYVGPDRVAELGPLLDVETVDLAEAPGTWKTVVAHPAGRCTLYGLPWGVLVYHLAEEAAVDSITEVALRRQEAHRAEPKWAAAHLQEVLPEAPVPTYVLSAFWMHKPQWQGRELETAMRLLCRPRTLLDTGNGHSTAEHALLLEQTLIREGFEDPDMVPFGVHGTSIGYASWSGVAYFPLAPERALSPERFVEFEVVAQALWAWCEHIRTEVEAGNDPTPPEAHGWRWLRGMMSRMTMPRPQETAQLKTMRESVMRSSGLTEHLAAALDILRDTPSQWKA